MQAKDIPDEPILRFLAKQTQWATHGDGYSMPTVQDAVPSGTPLKIQLAKMRMLLRRGLVDGCPCGCRGDWEITEKGRVWLTTQKANALPTVGIACSIDDMG